MIRRTFASGLLCSACAALACAASAQDGFPDRPMRIIVPFAVGGNTDVLARLFSQKLGALLKTSITVENKTGSGSVLGTDAVAKAPADGYTLLLGTSSHAINAALYPKLPYDSRKDFAFISMIAQVPMVLSVHPRVPATNPKELIALLRANPGKYSFASSGNGGSLHMAVELLKFQEQFDALHIPYRGAGPALTDTVAGQVDFIIDPVTTSAPFVKSGKLRALAVTTAQRSPVLPDLPTMQEAGFPNYETSTWNLLMAPAGTPAPVIARLSAALHSIAQDADFTRRLVDMGAIPLHMTPAETRRHVERETGQWARVIQSAGIRPE